MLGGFVDWIEAGVRSAVDWMYPFIRFMSDINVYIVAAVFILLVLYIYLVCKHSILDKLQNPRNYFAAIIMFVLYMMFAQAGSMKLGGGYALQFQSIVLPMAAKLFGPIIGGVVSIIFYMASFWLNQAQFNVNMLFISGISGMLYGIILYQYPTSFWRCLLSKTVITLVCNIMLYPFTLGIPADPIYTEFAVINISFGVTQSIIMIPIHSVLIYVELLIMRYIRGYLAESSWSLKN